MERFANFVLKLALNNHCKGLTTFRGGDTKGGGDEGLAVVVLRAETISGIGGGGVGIGGVGGVGIGGGI